MTSATASSLHIERADRVATVWLDRAGQRNAFNGPMIGELTAAFTQLGQDPDLRAIVLGGRGPAFCAGADLAWMRTMADQDWEHNRADAQALADMLWTLHDCPLPVVARVHGDCFAGGVGLAAACDIVVASEAARFCLSEARLGLQPATIAPYVVRALGEQACQRYFITAEVFGAEQAHQLGFVHELAPADQLDARVDGVVQALLANGPEAVKACKRLLRDVSGRPLDAGLRADTAHRIADIRASAEGQAGLRAFLSRQPPPWAAS